MADKTLAIRVNIEGSKKIAELQRNFDATSRARRNLNKAERDGLITTRKASKARSKLELAHIKNRNALNDERAAILKNNKALRKNSGFVAGVRKGVGQWATSMIGVTIAIAAVTKLVGGAVKIFKDFEKANSKLAAVTRASAEEMKTMSDQAKELGGSTAFTASQVTGLQIEFAKLGFPTDDIIQMTEATLAGAAALGSDLGEQAALTGALLKQFSLDASEAGRVNDVLAESAASSALDFSKLSTALPIVGATAKAVGVDLERTTAILGTLSDRGLDASTAGTSLRNVFLELSKQGLTMEQAMAKINGSTDKAKTSMELFGKRGATTGLILAETGESVDALEIKLTSAAGAAEKMADIMLDNLAGDITIAQSAWEGFILSMEDGEGSLASISRSAVGFFTGVLQGMTRAARSFDQNLLADINEINKGFSKNLKAQIADNIKNKEAESEKELAILRSRVNRGIETEEQFAEKRKKIEDDLSKFKENASLNALKNEAKQLELTNKKILKDTEGYELTLENAKRVSKNNQKDIIAKITGFERSERSERRTTANSILINQNRLEKLKQIIKQEEEANKLKNEKELNDKIVLEENLAKADDEKSQKEIEQNKKKNKKIAADKIKLEQRIENQIEAMRIAGIEEERDRTQQELIFAAQQKIDAITGNSEIEKELKLKIAEELRDALNEQKEVFKEEDKVKAEEEAEEDAIKEQEKRDIQVEIDTLNSDSDFETRRKELKEKELQEIAAAKGDAEQIALIKEKYRILNKKLDQEQGNFTVQLSAQVFSDLSGLAKEGSDEQKALATASALIQTYLGAAAAYTAGLSAGGPAGLILGPVMAAIAVATGLANVAKINGVQFEEGGVLQGASHSNGGIPFTIGGQSGFEAEGGEAIINKRSTAMFGDLLSEINQAGGGVPFAHGGLARKFAHGGAVPTSVGVLSGQQQIESAINLDNFSDKIIEGFNDKEVINVSTNTTEVAQDVINIQAEATF